MFDEFTEQSISGLNEKIMEIVKSYKGDFSEAEVLKQIISQSELLLATYNVRFVIVWQVSSSNLFTHNLDCVSEVIRDDETGEVKKDMEDLANKLTVVRSDSISDMDDAHYLTIINIAISEEKTLQIMTVYDRTVYELYVASSIYYV